MGVDWFSARHCRAAISTLLAKLVSRNENPPLRLPANVAPNINDDPVADSRPTITEPHNEAANNTATDNRMNRNKRRKYNYGSDSTNTANATNPTGQFEYVNNGYTNINTYASDFANRHPVLQYSGPDFGFDSASATNYQGGWENLLNQNFTVTPSGQFFNSDEWDMYMQSFGGRFDL